MEISPMYFFHLLLGWLWKFDVKAIHNAENISYVITKLGRKFQMDLLPHVVEEKVIGSSTMLLSGKEFLKVLKTEPIQEGYAIVLKPKEEPKKEKVIELPREVE